MSTLVTLGARLTLTRKFISKIQKLGSKFTAEISEKLNERNVEEKNGKLAVDLGFPRA